MRDRAPLRSPGTDPETEAGPEKAEAGPGADKRKAASDGRFLTAGISERRMRKAIRPGSENGESDFLSRIVPPASGNGQERPQASAMQEPADGFCRSAENSI